MIRGGRFSWTGSKQTKLRAVHLAYQSLANTTFLSDQPATNSQSAVLFSIRYQPPAKMRGIDYRDMGTRDDNYVFVLGVPE
jgi:hypothetical protein